MQPKKSLNLLDATLVVSGTMIGSGIFIVSADMSRMVGGPGWMMLLWLLAGVMTVFAALSYGELAGMFPQAGGQYVYLREAYNPLVGFLYGWSLFTVVQSGSIAAVAVAFAKYSGVIIPFISSNHVLIDVGFLKITTEQLMAITSVAILTVINARGIQYGKIVLRLFTSTKLIALLGLIILGIFIFGSSDIWNSNMTDIWRYGTYVKDESGAVNFESLTILGLLAAMGVGMVGSLFSSDAWNNVTFIAGEIENPKRNIPLGLFFGTLIVTCLYFLANVAYLHLLPFDGNPQATDVIGKGIMFAENDRVATSAVTQIFGGSAPVIMAVLIMISTFGCNNGIVLSSVRVYQEMARHGLFFEKMKTNNKHGEPEYALWIQFIWASILCLSGRYGDLLDYVMFTVILFYILTIIGIFILRKKMPNADRPYKAFGYPFIPLLYIIMAAAFCVNLLIMKPMYSWPGLGIVLLGVPIYYFWKRKPSTI